MKLKKRTLTLLEVMIVIFLITIITGVVGYNMKGTLERGKAFRTERAKEQLHDLLLLSLAEHGDLELILKNPKKAIAQTGLAKNPKDLLKDGWGMPFEIQANEEGNDFIIYSPSFEKYTARSKSKS